MPIGTMTDIRTFRHLHASATDSPPPSDVHELTEGDVDEELEESFPASDPPSWTTGIVVTDPGPASQPDGHHTE